MATIKDILALSPKPVDLKRRIPRTIEIHTRIEDTQKSKSLAYQVEVFRSSDITPVSGRFPGVSGVMSELLNYLFDHKQEMGIETIYRLKNQRMDRELVLAGGDRVTFEIKYRMNWLKACQSGDQFRKYLKMNEASGSQVIAGIVLFEEFSARLVQFPVLRRG